MNPQEEAQQAAIDNANLEKLIRSAYDTLFGYLQSVPDVYARAYLVRHLDYLYETSLNTIPNTPLESAETADVKTNSTSTISKDASTAS